MLAVALADLGTMVTYNPWTVTTDISLAEIVRMYTETEFQHWPVVDADLQLIGMVSEDDVLRTLEEIARPRDAGGDGAADCSLQLDRLCVQQFMTDRPISVDGRASLATALRLLSEHEVKALPVLEDARLVGLITSSDVLREFSYGDWPGASDTVTDAVQAVVESIESNASLEEAADALRSTGVDHLAVVRADFPLGVISAHDLRKARCLAAWKKLGESPSPAGGHTVRELVASAPSLRPGATLAQAAAVLVESRRPAAAVMNQAGRLLGVVSEDGILDRWKSRLAPV